MNKMYENDCFRIQASQSYNSGRLLRKMSLVEKIGGQENMGAMFSVGVVGTGDFFFCNGERSALIGIITYFIIIT